jgi:hypothetical protein
VIVEGGTPVLRPDGHYWRRKINRRVHRSRRVRLATRWSVLLSVNAVVLALLAYATAEVARSVQESPAFAVETIRVEGTRRVSADAVRRALAELRGDNVFSVDLDRVAGEVAALPWVRAVAVKRLLPDTLRVEVEEREPAAQAVVDGSVQVVDASGTVIGATGPALRFDLPVITGADDGPEETRRSLRARGVAALRALADEAPEWAPGLSEIDLSRADRISVVSSADEPRLYLDAEKPGRNLRSWLALRGEIADRLGTLDYVDLRWEGRIVAMPTRTVPR